MDHVITDNRAWVPTEIMVSAAIIAKTGAEIDAALGRKQAVVTNIIDTIGISADTRLSAGSGANKAQVGWAAIGANMDAASLIHLMPGDTLRIKGASLPDSQDGKSIAVSYSGTATFKVAGYIYNGYSWDNLEFTTVDNVVTITGPAERYLRLSLICTDASAVIATINEPIT